MNVQHRTSNVQHRMKKHGTLNPEPGTDQFRKYIFVCLSMCLPRGMFTPLNLKAIQPGRSLFLWGVSVANTRQAQWPALRLYFSRDHSNTESDDGVTGPSSWPRIAGSPGFDYTGHCLDCKKIPIRVKKGKAFCWKVFRQLQQCFQ